MSSRFALVAPLVALVSACRAPTCPPPGLGSEARFSPPFAPSTCSGPAPETPDVPGVVARARASIVSVFVGRAGGHGGTSTERGESAREHALGSGVLLTPDGLVLTSHHVVADADDVRVELDDRRSFRGAVVARDAWLDVALLRLPAARGLPSAVLGSSDGTAVGAPVMVIGNPFGLGPTVTRGILSAKGRTVDEGPTAVFLQTDAAVNPGDSGGPLLDAEGRVIGVTTAILEHGQGVSFAVPIDDVRHVLVELLATGRVARGHAGLTYQPVDAAIARALGLPHQTGAIVTEVDAGGPAARAGIGAGDVILALDDHGVREASDLAHELSRRRPGDTPRFLILRDGRHQTFRVLLARRHDAGDEPTERASLPQRRGTAGLGLQTADAEGGGARVEAVDPAGRAADELRPGDVIVELNRRAVRSAAELGQHLARATRPSTLLMRVRREGAYVYLGVDLE